MNKKVETYLENLTNWHSELKLLRNIALSCNLEEDFKWRNPCYTHQNKNIFLLFNFKEYCGITLFKGALLKDEKSILVQQTENMQSARQLRFKNLEEILENESLIKAYIFEAIEIERLNKKVKTKSVSEFNFPEELTEIFDKNVDFEEAFYSLTPGRQKGYLLFFDKAKQSKTRISRIEKYRNRIFDGKGINDCVCGLSKRMPNCDGSHKQLET
ncbi:YdeI/OmpD-associated family protein [Polaribacter pectinis]|uniref:YdeI/OmpD-associated family protein n=1 Tax=Polaribacter pectinis TaxID=2738844 RepID=A0A7G9LEF8_9FLAO|nr:DUF1801 domain-containing protein [Polaribacter pectinis]QNM87007.1 YdeI/OmpD-associated family protein [Polaribacter pectinis]